jgi:Iron dependent repressor, metal binding and dimerisation domain/ABC 3 transport family
VAALQAVGVVLVTAILVIPASTARLCSDRMSRVIFIAVGVAILSGVLGAFISYLWPGLPTGPIVVLVSAAIFMLAVGFGPNGMTIRWWRYRQRSARVQRENTLKALWQYHEHRGVALEESVFISEFALYRGLPPGQAERLLGSLVKERWAKPLQRDGFVILTAEGIKRAMEVIRNHRLWEAYLTHTVGYAADHVHADAEVMEHLLNESDVNTLVKDLNYPEEDPHGKKIPTINQLS